MHHDAQTFLDTELYQCVCCKGMLHATDFPKPGEYPLAEKYLTPLLRAAFGNIDVTTTPQICDGCADELVFCDTCGTIDLRKNMTTDEYGLDICNEARCFTDAMLEERAGCDAAHRHMEDA